MITKPRQYPIAFREAMVHQILDGDPALTIVEETKVHKGLHLEFPQHGQTLLVTGYAREIEAASVKATQSPPTLVRSRGDIDGHNSKPFRKLA
jgi:hypothetical protein